jgi:hypothetical protein
MAEMEASIQLAAATGIDGAHHRCLAYHTDQP